MTILSPSIPFLFMGEEFDEPAPFHYFIDHIDPALVESVRAGRLREFTRFHWQVQPPDPKAVDTFNQCRLNHALKTAGRHAVLWRFYHELLRLRRELPAIRQPLRNHGRVVVLEEQSTIIATREYDASTICVCAFW